MARLFFCNHPINEPGYRKRTLGSINQHPWNTTKHKRKFIKRDGIYLDNGIQKSCLLYFWGEYEPYSQSTYISKTKPKGVHYDIKPVKNLPPMPMGALDTDPYVYGCFRNICCEIKRQKYQHGDIIVFGHFISDSKFEFDTIIVVNKPVPCGLVPTHDQYRLASIDPLFPKIPDCFYDGIMYNKDTKYYSFVPCIPACNANGTDAIITNTFKKPILDVYTMFGRKAKNSWYGKTFANEPLTTTSKLDKTWRTIINAVKNSGLKIGIYVEKIDNEKIF